MKESYTYNEIKSQNRGLKKILNEIINNGSKINADIFSKNYDQIIFFGCGSSYNIAMSASFFIRYLSNINTLALPSSELIFNSDAYIKRNKQYLLIGFSRSGETTESIDVVNRLKGKTDIDFFVFTCRKKSTFTNIVDNYYICKEVKEKSVVMTKSFSSMLFACCVMFTKFIKGYDMIKEFNKLINYLDGRVPLLFKTLKEYVDKNDIKSFFALGSGFNYGLAVEADLKMKEMSQTPSYSYNIFEFNHGPKSLLDKDTLCLFLTINKNLGNLDFIIREILKLDSKVVIIGNANISEKLNKEIKYFLTDEDFRSDLVRSFINIPFFQILAYMQTIKKGLNPDKPKDLSYTTKIK